MIPFLIIGNPANRRVRDFVTAVRTHGGPPPIVLAHRDLLEDFARLDALPNTPHWVRIDALGEDAEVERKLLALGYAQAPDELDPSRLRRWPLRHGEVLAPRQHHRGLLRYLGGLNRIFDQRPAWRVLSPTAAIERLFDKTTVWRQHREAGLPVPQALDPAPTTPDALRDGMQARGWRSAYVKMTCGSSASGLGVFMTQPTERFMTTLARRDNGWFNSLKVRRVSRQDAIDEALGFILAQGAHVERAVPKARLDGAFFDLRVLVIDGQPSFTVVRQSRHPITNLHLGGWRGDLEHLRAAVPADSLAAAYETCRRAAALQGCFHLGLDLLFEPGLRAHRLVEANAFGDLIPGLRLQGRSVYGHQVHRLALQDTGRENFHSGHTQTHQASLS